MMNLKAMLGLGTPKQQQAKLQPAALDDAAVQTQMNDVKAKKQPDGDSFNLVRFSGCCG